MPWLSSMRKAKSEAVWKQSLYKRRPYVICGARLRTDILDNRSLAMLLEISKGLIYQTLVSGQPLTPPAYTKGNHNGHCTNSPVPVPGGSNPDPGRRFLLRCVMS